MSDLHHTESRRADVLAVVLNLVGLAGLSVMLFFVASDSGLWPSFSGDRVYTASNLLAAEREETTPAPTQWAPAPKLIEAESALKRVEAEEVMWREPVGVRPGACEARAASLQAQAEARRRQQHPSCKRARLLSRRATMPTPTV